MKIAFKNRRLQKALGTVGGHKKLGAERRRKLRARLAELEAASTLADLGPPLSPPARCHELKGKLAGHFSVDLDHPYRLIFLSDHNPPPMLPTGGLDWSKIRAVVIQEVRDTHE